MKSYLELDFYRLSIDNGYFIITSISACHSGLDSTVNVGLQAARHVGTWLIIAKLYCILRSNCPHWENYIISRAHCWVQIGFAALSLTSVLITLTYCIINTTERSPVKLHRVFSTGDGLLHNRTPRTTGEWRCCRSHPIDNKGSSAKHSFSGQKMIQSHKISS